MNDCLKLTITSIINRQVCDTMDYVLQMSWYVEYNSFVLDLRLEENAYKLILFATGLGVEDNLEN